MVMSCIRKDIVVVVVIGLHQSKVIITSTGIVSLTIIPSSPLAASPSEGMFLEKSMFSREQQACCALALFIVYLYQYSLQQQNKCNRDIPEVFQVTVKCTDVDNDP